MRAPQKKTPRLTESHLPFQHANRRRGDLHPVDQRVRVVAGIWEDKFGPHLLDERQAQRAVAEMLRLLRDQEGPHVLLTASECDVFDQSFQRFEVEAALI